MKKHHKNYVNRTAITFSCLLGIVLAVVGAVQVIYGDIWFGIVTGIVGFVALIYNMSLYIGFSKSMSNIVDMVADDKENDYTSDVIHMFPLPMSIMRVDGSVLWYNDAFSDMTGKDSVAGLGVSALLPGLKWGYILQSKGPVSLNLEHNNRIYRVRGRIVHRKDDKDTEYLVYLVFVDKTSEERFRRLYTEEKTDVTIVSIDNMDYIMQKTDDSNSENVMYKISKEIGNWVQKSGGVLKKTDRDRFLVLFEHKNLNMYIEEKFDILEKIREIGEEVQIPLSISMGIGTGGSISENEKNARNALDMAVGRGGDQAVIKDETQYKFFGARNSEYEKSNRLKTRAVAKGLKGFIEGVDKVLLVGHKGLDYDCFGAAMGLQRIVRTLGKNPYILIDSPVSVMNLYKQITEIEEYDGMFVTEDQALNLMDQNTLLVILDTSRNSLLPSTHILSRTEKIVVIDHHRRPADYINPCSLMYNEPFASSACEMVTELLQYMSDTSVITPIEAQCLYMGILMDTKNFLLKTGVRTFEAASYLKRVGLDTVAVKKMFNIDKREYVIKSQIIEGLEHITDTITMAVCHTATDNIRALASQAADDMLNVDNSQCSFVLYSTDKGIGISGRSFGDINVQLILETLGGGGHQTVAGVQLDTSDMDVAKQMLRSAVEAYASSDEK